MYVYVYQVYQWKIYKLILCVFFEQIKINWRLNRPGTAEIFFITKFIE